MNFIKRLWISIKNKKNIICIAIIILCVISCICCAVVKIKKDSTYQIGEFDAPEMFDSNINQAQFGTKTLSKPEYSFIYYSLLYSSFPELKSKSYDELNYYINHKQYGTDENNNPYSLATAIQQATEETIISMYSYNQDIIDKDLNINCDDMVSELKNTLYESAKASGHSSINSYLSDYYGENTSESDLDNIITDYAKYRYYMQNYLFSQQLEITDEELEKQYNDIKDVIDNFYIDIIAYYPNESLKDKSVDKKTNESIKKDIDNAYTEIHKRDDMLSYAKKLMETYNSDDKTIINNISGDDALSGYYLYLISSDVYNWAISSDIKQDAAAIFKTDDCYIISYFNKREKPDSPSITGIQINPTRKFEMNEDGTAVIGATIYSNKEDSPYYQTANQIKTLIDSQNKVLNLDTIKAIVDNVDLSQYNDTEPINIGVNQIKFDLIDNIYSTDDKTKKELEKLSPNSSMIIKNDEYFFVFYKTYQNIPYYKGQIILSLYDEECKKIEETYKDMFSNISYFN